jgi:hypothetical protein
MQQIFMGPDLGAQNVDKFFAPMQRELAASFDQRRALQSMDYRQKLEDAAADRNLPREIQRMQAQADIYDRSAYNRLGVERQRLEMESDAKLSLSEREAKQRMQGLEAVMPELFSLPEPGDGYEWTPEQQQQAEKLREHMERINGSDTVAWDAKEQFAAGAMKWLASMKPRKAKPAEESDPIAYLESRTRMLPDGRVQVMQPDGKISVFSAPKSDGATAAGGGAPDQKALQKQYLSAYNDALEAMTTNLDTGARRAPTAEDIAEAHRQAAAAVSGAAIGMQAVQADVRQSMGQPRVPGDPTSEWMVEQYRRMDAAGLSPEAQEVAGAFMGSAKDNGLTEAQIVEALDSTLNNMRAENPQAQSPEDLSPKWRAILEAHDYLLQMLEESSSAQMPVVSAR